MGVRESPHPAVQRTVAALGRFNDRHPWSHNDHFHPWILRNLPKRRGRALDVGCGQGALLAKLSPHFEQVHGTDLDPVMRSQSSARCAGLANVTVDAQQLSEVDGQVDLVTMIAVLHHLDARDTLTQIKRLLAPGGRLLVVGLAPPLTTRDKAWDILSVLSNPVIGLIRSPRAVTDGGRLPPFPIADPELSFDELRAIVAEVIPGAGMRHRIAFRHTISWTKPSA